MDDGGTEIDFLPLETFDILIYRGDDVSESPNIIDKQAWPGHSTNLENAIQSELEEYLKEQHAKEDTLYGCNRHIPWQSRTSRAEGLFKNWRY